MKLRQFALRYLKDESAVSGLLFAISMTVLLASAAFAVDLGSMYLAKRKLQGLADAAALTVSEGDFTGDTSTPVSQLIIKDGSQNVRVMSMVAGTYVADASIPAAQRFTPGPASTANAMQVTLEQQIPLSFGALITGSNTARITAQAMASRQDMAAYSIGTRLTNLTGNLPNQVLSAFASTSLNLSTSDISTLASSQIDLLAVGDAIAASQGLTGKTYGEIFNRTVSPATLLNAYATAAGSGSLGDMLRAMAAKVGSGSIDLSALVDLGPLANTDFRDPANPFSVNAYTLVRGALELSQGTIYDINLSLTDTGLASAVLRIAGVNATQHSPMLTVTAARNYVLRTGSARVYLDTQIASSLAGIATLHVPIYSELAPGEARMSAISCTGNPLTDGVTLGVKPAIGSAAIGTVDTSLFDDFSAPLTVSQVTMASTIPIKIKGYSNLSLSGNAEQSVFFSLTDISNHAVKSVWSSDITSSLAGSLVSNLQLTVTVLGLGLNVSAISATVGTTLQAVSPTIDSILDTTLRSAGIGIGVSDVSVDRVRCGAPMLVG